MTKLTLKLFGAVEAKETGEIYILKEGLIISQKGGWAKDEIIEFYKSEKLSGNDLNKTFHKSWEIIEKSTKAELFKEQIKHYITGYGTNFENDLYIPAEKLELPTDLRFVVIKTYSKKELTDKCLSVLCSGMALTEETIMDVINLLKNLEYKFTGAEGIKNKEAIVIIANMFGVYPNDPVEFMRYIVFKATGDSLLIKNDKVIAMIKESKFDPELHFHAFGVEKLSSVFNRFKPLFLAFKSKCPSTVNKLSKLSKKHHKPLVSNPLNNVTNTLLIKEDTHWLQNATIYALLNAVNVCTVYADKEHFVYNVRNGKSWTMKKDLKKNTNYICELNKEFILKFIKDNYNFSRKVFLPKNISYAIPTSEKKMVGNIPYGTKVYGDKLACGVYWENSWGARDLDLSAVSLNGEKIGWNASYTGRGLKYSGDITDAPNGAVEYLHASDGIGGPQLIYNNVFSGSEDAGYKIIVGDDPNIDHKYMMDPNNLVVEEKVNAVGKGTVIGMMIQEEEGVSFTFLNSCLSRQSVSGGGEINKIANEALYHDITNSIKLEEILEEIGFEIVDELNEEVLDLSIDKLEKDTFIKLFE